MFGLGRDDLCGHRMASSRNGKAIREEGNEAFSEWQWRAKVADEEIFA